MSESMHRSALALAVLLAAGASSALASSKEDQDFAGLLGLLPGTYQNFTQANSDKSSGIEPAHGKELLTVLQLEAQVLAEHVFYVVESAADDSHRIFSGSWSRPRAACSFSRCTPLSSRSAGVRA